jgi:hypothetical protein
MDDMYRLPRLLLALCFLLAGCQSEEEEGWAAPEPVPVSPHLLLGTFESMVNVGAVMGAYPHPMLRNGDALYLPGGDARGVLVLDVSDVTQPRVSMHLAGYDAHAVAQDGNRLVLVEREVLHVLDSSDPLRPQWRGQLRLSTGGEFPAVGVAVSGTTVLVGGGGAYLGSASALTAVDISDPAHPVVRDAVPEWGTAALAVAGSHAFAASYEAGLRVFAIGDPANLSLVAALDVGFSATQLQVVGDRLYLGGPVADFAGDDFAFAIIDIGTPAAPRLVSRKRLAQGGGSGFYDGFRGMTVNGDRAYLAFADQGALVIDIADETAPAYRGMLGPAEFVGGVAYKDGHVLLASRSGLFAVPEKRRGLFTPPTPVLATASVGTLLGSEPGTAMTYISNPGTAGGRYPRTPQWRGDHMFLPAGSGMDSALFILGATPPAQPPLLATSAIASGDIAFAGDVMYSVNGVDLLISDASDPLHISLQQTVHAFSDWPMAPAALAQQGGFLYVAAEYPSDSRPLALQVLDISAPLAPVRRGSSTGCGSADIVVAGSYAYVAGRESGLCIYDISDPDQPVLVSRAGSTGLASAVAVVGSLAYVRNSGQMGDTLAIFDIADLQQPVLKSLLMLSDAASGSSDLDIYGLAVAGNRAYVGLPQAVVVVDIGDAARPVVLGRLPGADGYNSGIALHDGLVYVASWQGLKVWQP